MDKTVYSGSILISLTLLAGSWWVPNSAGMWLASTSLSMNIARLIIIGLMVGLLLTNPPRRRGFRLLLGATALIFASLAAGRLWSGSVQIVDAMLFLEVAVAFGLAAMEGEPLPRLLETKPIARENLLASRFGNTSNMQGLLMPRVRLAELAQRAVIMAAILSGALSQNLKPYRSLWRGS